MFKLLKTALVGLAFLSPAAFAVCPLCVVAMGAGIGLSRWLHVDDLISGLWIGGLMMALLGWTIQWLNRHDIRFLGRKILLTLLFYGSLFWTLRAYHLLGQTPALWKGLDRLQVGILAGSVGVLCGLTLYLFWIRPFRFGKLCFTLIPLLAITTYSLELKEIIR